MSVFLQPADLPDGLDVSATPRDLLDIARFEEYAAGVELAERAAKASREKQMRDDALDALFRRDTERLSRRLERERDSSEDGWTPGDVRKAYSAKPIEPDVGEWLDNETSNGGGVFYSGKVNGVHGPSESGKTMLCLAVAAQLVRRKEGVLMIDFEDDIDAVIGRMRDVFGLTEDELDAHFIYLNPVVAFHEQAYERIKAMEGLRFCIVDAVTESMSLSGLDGRNENDIATWMNEFPKKIAALGLAVCLVDHTPIGEVGRQIGSQHKKSAVTGVSYSAKAGKQFTPGRKGTLRIRIAKDKVGAIRKMALFDPENEQAYRGELVIDGSVNPAHPYVGMWGVHPADINAPPKDDSTLDQDVMPGAPTKVEKDRILFALRGDSVALTGNDICEIVGQKRNRVLLVLRTMRDAGEIRAVKSGNSILHSLLPAPPTQPELE